MDSIENDDPLLTAHIAKVNSDITGLGSDFEGTVTLLVAVDPVARKHEKSADKKKKGPLISSTIAGRGEKTGVNLQQNQLFFVEHCFLEVVGDSSLSLNY